MATISKSAGYEPRNGLYYQGNSSDYLIIWETSILSYLFTHNKDVCTEILPRGEDADHKDYADQNHRDFVEPGQFKMAVSATLYF